MDAKREKIPANEAVALARRHDTVVAMKGKKVVSLAMQDNPTDEEIIRLIVGPSGNLRAPSWTRNQTLVVGFNADAYDALLA